MGRLRPLPPAPPAPADLGAQQAAPLPRPVVRPPAGRFPCLAPGGRYTGCIGRKVCGARGTPRCLFGGRLPRPADAPAPPAA
jgi:hypothetical protein